MQVFMTGAAGPLGRVLTAALLRRGDSVIGLTRRHSGASALQQLGASPRIGALDDRRALVESMRGCDLVIHLAQFFDFWSPTDSVFDDVNARGTANVLASALKAGVPRLVLCSSALVSADDFPPRRRGAKKLAPPVPPANDKTTAFARSMIMAERTAMALRGRGMDIVIARPALVVAANDPGWTGRMIARCAQGRVRFASDAEVGWVSVGDVARGIMRAAAVGEDGESYVLSGVTLSFRAFLTRVAREAGQAPPHGLPRAVARAVAMAAATLGSRLQRPRISADEVRLLSNGVYMDGGRAADELGLDYTPLPHYLPNVVRSYLVAAHRFS